MKVSEIEKYRNMHFGLAKFTDRIDSFLNGDIYMNNLKTYINMEKETGKKGQGDKLEAAHVYADVQFNMIDKETKKTVLSGKAKQANFRFNEDELTPVYCMFAIHGENLSVVGEDDEYYYTEFNLTKEEVDNIIRDFGEDLILVNPRFLISKLTDKLEELNYSYKCDIVNYDDYGVNYSDRLNAYKSLNHDVFFWKDKQFTHQHEYRIVLTDKVSEVPITINIGRLPKEHYHIYKAREFFEDIEIILRK